MTGFDEVVPALAQALRNRGYTELTPVQQAVLAPELRDADALVSAQTGSGKTVAFGLALAPTLLAGAERFQPVRLPAPPPLALAVAPTRELALQVRRELEWLYAETGATVASCVGGMDMRMERQILGRGAHIVVGTPGRLRDHIERGSLDMSGLRAVVLDEADEMLDLGFREDLEFILKAAPAERRTMMYSATVPRTIASLAKRYQRDAVRISTAAERSQHVDIEYQALMVSPRDQENAIINVLRYHEPKTALVFCGTRAAVNRMTSRFNNRGFSVVALSGELSQNERTHALQAIRDGRARVCIATDVAARGIDLPDLELVIHADLPKNPESLLHRSGRTGRAGRKGVSVLIVPHRSRAGTERLLRAANIDATWARPPSVDDIMRRDDERLFADPILTEAPGESETMLAEKLLVDHGATHIAAAFIRLHRAGRSAPEELSESGPVASGPKRDVSFTDAVWVSLSVGRDDKAEARWILPMLCKSCDVTKHDVGRIRIQQRQTFVELTASSIDRFLAAIGPSNTLEKTITVARLAEKPADLGDTRGDSHPRARPRRRPERKHEPTSTFDPMDKPAAPARTDFEPAEIKPAEATRAERPPRPEFKRDGKPSRPARPEFKRSEKSARPGYKHGDKPARATHEPTVAPAATPSRDHADGPVDEAPENRPGRKKKDKGVRKPKGSRFGAASASTGKPSKKKSNSRAARKASRAGGNDGNSPLTRKKPKKDRRAK